MSDYTEEPNEFEQINPAPRPARSTLQRPVRAVPPEGNWFTRDWNWLKLLFALLLFIICGGLFWILANNTIVKPMN